MKLKHAAIGLAIMGLSSTAAAHQCTSRTINKGKITDSFKLDVAERTVKGEKQKTLKKVLIYLPTPNPRKLVQLMVPGLLVDEVRKKDENSLGGIFYHNSTIAKGHFERGKNSAQWECKVSPMELPAEEEGPASSQPAALEKPKPAGGAKTPEEKKSEKKPVEKKIAQEKPAKPPTSQGSPEKMGAKPAEKKPAKPKMTAPTIQRIPESHWEHIRNRRAWLPVPIEGRPSENLITDNGKPWKEGDFTRLQQKLYPLVMGAFNASSMALEGTLYVRLKVDPEGYVKTIQLQGAVTRESAEWYIKIFVLIRFSPGLKKDPELNFKLK